jgi:hypothetical protein
MIGSSSAYFTSDWTVLESRAVEFLPERFHERWEPDRSPRILDNRILDHPTNRNPKTIKQLVETAVVNTNFQSKSSISATSLLATLIIALSD